MAVSALVPAYNRVNVITGQARIFLADPYADPDNPPALPPDTLELGADWPDLWTPVGATTEGLSFEFSRDTQDITIEEQSVPVDQRTNSTTFTANVTLAEDTIQTMRWAYGGGLVTVTAATADTPGVTELRIAPEMEDFAFAFESMAPSKQWRRVLVPIMKSIGDIKTAYRRADAQRSYETSFQSLVEVDQVVIREATAPATGTV